MSTNGAQLDELQFFTQSLAARVQNSTSAAAFAAAEAKKEQAATSSAITSTMSAITSMGNDVKKVEKM